MVGALGFILLVGGLGTTHDRGGLSIWVPVAVLLVLIGAFVTGGVVLACVRVVLTPEGVTIFEPGKRHVPWGDVARVEVVGGRQIVLVLTNGGVVRTPLRRGTVTGSFDADLATLRRWHQTAR